MQAYAKAELAQAEPAVNLQQSRDDREVATELAAESQVCSGRSTSSALAALVLDELDEKVLGLLATRLAPHLRQLEARNPTVPHVAYTVHSLATDLGVSAKTVRCAIARGELHAVKRGSRWVIPADAVSEWATPSTRRRTAARSYRPRPPKAAGPSLRSVLGAGRCGGSR